MLLGSIADNGVVDGDEVSQTLARTRPRGDHIGLSLKAQFNGLSLVSVEPDLLSEEPCGLRHQCAFRGEFPQSLVHLESGVQLQHRIRPQRSLG